MPASARPGCRGPDLRAAVRLERRPPRTVAPSLLAITGLVWAAIAVLFFVTYAQVQALVIFGVPGALFVATALGWWDGRRWTPGVAVLAVIGAIALACVILVGRFGLAGVPGAG